MKNKRINLLVKAVLGSMLLCDVVEIQAQTPPDVTAGVVDLGPTGTWEVFSLVRHRERLYMINGAQGKVASARYFDLTSNSFAADGSIPLEEPYGGVVKQGDLLWYGEDAVGPGGSLLHVRRHDGWKSYRPPTPANEHAQSQWIYDGKIFLADYYNSYPGMTMSPNAGASYVSRRIAGQNGFKATIDGVAPLGCLVDNFFEYKGNLFATSLVTQLTATTGSANAENFMMRYTGDLDKPWELTYDRLSQLGFLGRPTSFGAITSTTRAGDPRWTSFKNYLFMDWYGVLNRYSPQSVVSKFDPLVSYERPANPVNVGNNLTANGTTVLPGGNSKYFSVIVRHGFVYIVDSPPGGRVIRRSSDGVNFTNICQINTAAGSPLATLNDKTLFIEIVGEDIYFIAGTRLYKIPGSLLGSNKPSGLANTAPVAANDSYTVTTGFSTMNDALLGPLRNDKDADDDAFYASLVTPPANGAVVLRYNGTFEYSAFGGFSGTDSFSYKINDGYGESTATVTVTGAALPANNTFTGAKINFQSGSTAPPAGWIIDSGSTRAARNGLFYGWDGSQGGLNRTENASTILNTLMRMGAGARWQMSVPNGTYQVKATLGDAAAATSGMILNVEGVNYLDRGTLPANQFFDITDIVTVTDGWLSVDNGTSAASATKINALEIIKLSSVLAAPAGLTATAVSSSQINLAWTDNATSETGFQLERKLSSETTWTLLTTVGSNITSYSHGGLMPFTGYSYRVRAINAASVSPWSPTAAALTSAAPLPASDPVYNPALRWSFDEISGSTAMSSGSVNLPVNLTGSPVWNSAGQINGALQLNGTTQFGRVTDNDQLDAVNKFAISFWVRPANLTGAPQFIVSKRASSSSQIAYSLFFFTGNKLFVDIDGTANRFSSNTVFSNNVWYHIAVVFDGTLTANERVKLYVNGALNMTGSETSTILPNSTADLFVGRGDSASNERFNGLIDDLRLYRASLDGNQIANLFNANIPPSAVGDAVTLNEGGSSLVDVLANDSDPDSQPSPLSISNITAPGGGIASLEAGKIRYTPRAGFYGSDTFSYTITDGAATAMATVSVTVNNTALAGDLTGAGLTGTNIGSGSSGFSRVLSNGSWEINGAGSGLSTPADSARMEQRAITGNFDLIVRVRDFTGQGANPRAGLMLRESSAAGSRGVYLSASLSGTQYRYGVRSLQNGSPVETLVASPVYSYPNAWMLIRRSGDVLTLSVSSDDTTYTQVGQVTLAGLSNALTVGIFSTSGTPGTIARAVFSDFEIVPDFLRWAMNETSGTVASDSSGNGLNATLTGSPIWTAGKVGGALSLNGSTQFGQVADSPQLDGTNKLSISLWVRPTNLDSTNPRFLVSKRINATNNCSYALYFHTGNKLFVDIDGSNNRFSTNTTFANNTWYHIALTYDGTAPAASRVKLYVNGLLNRTAAETSASIPNYASDLWFGQANASYSTKYGGLLDEVQILRHTLTSSEIESLAGLIPSEVIVDNAAATGVLRVGTWTTSTAVPGYYGANFLHDGNSGKGTKTVKFTPTITASGSYNVYIHYTSDATRASNAPVDIIHSGGTAALSLDQRTGGGTWVLLGAYDFAAGTSGSVTISNTGTTGFVVADAIRLVPN